ncbi:ABC transporter substrate-binding protein [Psychromonas sp. L1A2]|uniref:ABC transporter substrate-binding protein n=1 Tax=Psychromonas sp. L1A2 TaxID=2686356 RepID=UPI001F2860CB|nr:ABC transporter substrate-binding protein [Psychromonas sp. L1A2]
MSLKKNTLSRLTFSVSCLWLVFCSNAIASPFEVLHWWTEQGELESKQVLVKHLKVNDIEFEDFAIVGSGGGGAIHVLQMRALSGNPPEAAQIKGPDIAEWNNLSMLIGINELTDTSAWEHFLPKVVIDDITVEKQYMAVPINIHRVNWLWLNTKIFNQYGLAAPTTWKQFFSVANFLASKGVKPVVFGGTPWQDALLFESVAISELGAEKYKQAFVAFNHDVISSIEMVNTFKLFKQLHRYATPEQQGQDWTWSSKAFINNKAAMLFMGDWVKGSWTAIGKKAMQDYQCVPVPGTKGVFSYNIDSFVLFKKAHSSIDQHSQSIFVETLISPEFQQDFSQLKGSIPARTDLDLSAFDECSQLSSTDFKEDIKVPSFTQNMATSSHQKAQIIQLISDYFNSDSLSAEEAVKQLGVMVKALTSK